MYRKKSKLKLLSENKYFQGVQFVLCGILGILTAIVIFAVLMTSTDLTEDILNMLGIVALSVGGFITGYVSGKKKRKNGILNGLLFGGILFCTLFFLGFPIAFNGVSGMFLIKLTVILLFSAIGGVKGVNTRYIVAKKC